MIGKSAWLQWFRSCFSSKNTAEASQNRRHRTARRNLQATTLEQLEDRVLLAATTFDSGTLTIDFSTASEAVTISNNGTNITISSSDSVTGAGNTFATNTITRLVVTDSGALTGQALTISGSADYALSSGVSITGAESATVARAISTSAADLSVTVGQSINVTGSLAAIDGNILLSANQQPDAAIGTFDGIIINGTSVTTTGTGTVTLLGRGGNSGAAGAHGVDLTNGATVSGRSTTVTGTGGDSAGSSNIGILLTLSSTITSTGGSVQVTGTGSGSGGSNTGVSVESGSVITATGDATVMVSGTGSGTGNFSYGVSVASTNSAITSANGAVTVIGTGGAGGSGNGVAVQIGGMLSAGGSGTLTVTGTATSTEVGSFGVLVSTSNSLITSNGGTVNLTAISNGNPGLFITNGSITSGSDAEIEIITNSISLSTGGTINSGSGSTTIKTYSAGTLISIGGADVTTGPNLTLGLTDAELDRIIADTLTIGDATAGEITVSSAITHSNNLTLTTGAGVTISQSITLSSDKDLAVNAVNTINLTGSTSDLTASAGGAISLTTLQNVQLGGSSSISTVDGDILVSANQQTTASVGNFIGIQLLSGTITASGTGTVTLMGRGGNDASGSQHGILVNSSTVSARTTSVLGIGGPTGSNSRGVAVFGSIKSTGGGVTVRGFGGGSGAGTGNQGIYIGSGSIREEGAGDVTVEGTGGATAGGSNNGVEMSGSSAVITSAGGDVHVTGFGGANGGSGSGVSIVNLASILSGGNGSLTIEGTGANGQGIVLLTGATFGSNNGAISLKGIGANGMRGVHILDGSTVTAGGNANLQLTTNSLDLTGTISSGTGQTTILTTDPATPINIGGSDVLSGTLTLGLSAAELNLITAGTLIIGDSTAGDITVSGGVAPATISQIELVTGTQIIDNNSTGVDITVTRLGLTAATGIGVGNALDTAVGNLEATTVTGGVFISNTGDLDIGNINGTLSGLKVTGASGGIQIDNVGSVSVSESLGAPESITLNSNGSNSDAIVSAGNDSIRSTAGNVTLTAGRDLLLGFNGNNGDARSNSGLLSLTAGRDIVVSGDTYAVGGSSNATTGRDFSILNTALFNAVGGGGTASVTTGSGGTVTINTSNSGVTRRGIATNNGAITLVTDNLIIGPLGELGSGSATITVRTATEDRPISLGRFRPENR